MYSNYSGYYGWNSAPLRFVPNSQRFRCPPRRILPHVWQSGANSDNPYGQTDWGGTTPSQKRRRLEETNEIEENVFGVEQKDQMLQTDEDELIKELRRDKQRLEEQIEEIIQQGTQTKFRLLEQKLEDARKEEAKLQQRTQQLGKKHNQYVISAQSKEAAFKDRIKEAEDQNSALKKENEALKTEAEGDRIFSEVQKLEHSHFLREKELKDEVEREKNKREELKTRIRILKDEHETVRAANKLTHEKREKNMKTEIAEAEKTIKGLKKDKKRLRRTKTNSELLVHKLRLEISDVKTGGKKEKQAVEDILERRAEAIKNADECIRELRSDNQQLKLDSRKKIEDLEDKLKQAESGNHILGTSLRLQQLMQNGDQGNGVKTEMAKIEERSKLAAKVSELESELWNTKESLELMTLSRDAAVQRETQLELEHRYKLNQIETSAKEIEELSLLLSGMTPNEFVEKHQQLIDQQQSTQAKLKKSLADVKRFRNKQNEHEILREQHKKTNAKLAVILTEKEKLAKELQGMVDRLKNETDQNKKLKSELSKGQALLEGKPAALEQQKNEQISISQLKKKCEQLEREKAEEKKAAKAEVENVMKQLKSLELEATELKKQMDDLAADGELKTQMLSAKEKELKEVKHQLTLLKEKHDLKVKPTQEESCQTDSSDFGSKPMQMSEMEVELLNLLNGKDEQIAKLNDMLAKVQQQLNELRGEN